MSRWLTGLNQVSNLLEQLDDRVENVAEERAFEDEADEEQGALDDILAKRGLLEELQENTEAQVGEKATGEAGGDSGVDLEAGAEKPKDSPKAGTPNAGLATDKEEEASTPDAEQAFGKKATDSSETQQGKPKEPTASKVKNGEVGKVPSKPQTRKPDTSNMKPLGTTSSKAAQSHVVKQTSTLSSSESKAKDAMVASKEAQKEVRGLRRHIVKLNKELEHAEHEVGALRDELSNAAGLMEKEIGKVKTRGEKERKETTEKFEKQRSSYEDMLKEQNARHQSQCEEYDLKIIGLEQKLRQEGGDWSKERAEAMEREQDINGHVSSLEEEKAVLLSQVSTLQSQQVALGSRLESLSEAADNAMARARDAEDKLDDTLENHAKQISQRQAREAALEQTVHDLNAALVVANSRTSKSLSDMKTFEDTSSTPETSLVRQIHTLEEDLSVVTSQLGLEKERSSTLQAQLKEIAKDSTQEASTAHARLIKFEREASEMRMKISRLTTDLQVAKRESDLRSDSAPAGSPQNESSEQIAHLTEEVLRLRERLAEASSTTLTLKNKLKVARDKAAEAEDKLVLATMNTGNDYNARPRGGMTRRPKSGNVPSGSIRSALLLSPGQSDQVEKIGKAVDVVDSFAVSTGKYLRRNPLARAGFIFYLLLVHAWSFVLLFFHAHAVQVDGGHGQLGPHALMRPPLQEQLLNVQPLVDVKKNAAEGQQAIPAPVKEEVVGGQQAVAADAKKDSPAGD